MLPSSDDLQKYDVLFNGFLYSYGGTQKEYPYKKWLAKLRHSEELLKFVREVGYVIEQSDIDEFVDDSDTESCQG